MSTNWIKRSIGPAVVAVAMVTGGGSAAGATGAASAVGPATHNETDWAWVAQVTGNLGVSTPAAINRGNSAGLKNTVDHYSTGGYKITFKGVGGTGGITHVSTIGGPLAFCIAGDWGESAPHEIVYVSCYDGSGTPVDAHFNVSFLNTNEGTHRLGYVWAGEISDDYDASSVYNWNSSHHVNHVTRTGNGAYTVTFHGLGVAAGDVQVSAFLNGAVTAANPSLGVAVPADCKVLDWGPVGGNERVRVRCFNGNGLPQNSAFNVTFMEKQGLKGPAAGKVAYVFAGRASTASYTPAAAYRFSKPAGTAHVTRQAVGRYTVVLNNQGSGGTANVTAYGQYSVRCLVVGIRTSGAPQKVRVRCYTYGGDPIDSKFTLAYQA